MSSGGLPQKETMLGHPVGLYPLFFAEMWERFSYYGMRALLILYMTKGFLRYGDSDAYAVYGAYCSLVYMTPFFGGMLADRVLGARRAVAFGGLLMCAGQALLMLPQSTTFFAGLALIICGNGFFKPNISTIVGTLYPKGSLKRDGGFTIFYMGINMGAALAPLLCGYIGELYGWQYGFGLASLGMLIGVAIFVAPTLLAQLAVLGGALAAAIGLCVYHPSNTFTMAVYFVTAAAVLLSACVASSALRRGGLPAAAGAPPDPALLRRRRLGGLLTTEQLVYLGALCAVPLFFLLVSGFAPFTENQRGITLVDSEWIKSLKESSSGAQHVLAVAATEISRPAGLALFASGVLAVLYLLVQTFRLDKIPRNRMYVVLILTFFSILFWSFFEQAGSSLNNFADRNVDRVFETRQVADTEVGTTIRFRIPMHPEKADAELRQLPLLTQEQLGRMNGNSAARQQIEQAIRSEEQRKAAEENKTVNAQHVDELVQAVLKENRFTMTGLLYLQRAAGRPEAPLTDKVLEWKVESSNVGMGIADDEMPASVFQSVNAIFIVLFGMAVSFVWSFLAARGLEPSTPVKFSLGLIQLGLGFAAFWWGAKTADSDGIVSIGWLLLGYLMHTTGELCLSPVGLSMVTRLSPAQLVSTVMGNWFLATAFAQLLAATIAQFTGVGTESDGGASVLPVPLETVMVYGNVFFIVAISAVASGLFCLCLSPVLKYWMHEGQE